MKTVLALALIAACSHSQPAPAKPTSTTSSADADAPVDPTLPSWAPRSCVSYHVAVVKLVDCPSVDQATRDEVKAKYEATNKGWHDLQNAQQSDIDGIAKNCTAETKSVQALSPGTCVASQP